MPSLAQPATALTALQRLKIDLMTTGLAISPAARRYLAGERGDCPLTLADYASTSGVTLCLDGDVWVNAPISDHNPNFVTHPAHTLDRVDDRFIVQSSSLVVAVRPIPVPEYHRELNRWGQPYTAYAITHADRVRISPIEGCALACKFCDLPYEFRYRRKTVAGLVDAVRRARTDRVLPARHVLISGGTPRPEDYGYLNEVYEAVLRDNADMHVDIMMVPCPGLMDLDHLHRTGVHGLSINLEIFNEDVARRIMPRKASLTRQYYLDFIERAAQIFTGPGRIRSLLLVGLESTDDTLRGVEALAQRGCSPVLSPFRPDPATPLRSLAPPDAGTLGDVYLRSVEIADRYGVRLGPTCTPCQHNTLTFPESACCEGR